MVRFYWRRDISKKTKIMRKVVFPFSLDLSPILHPDLLSKVKPVAEKLVEVEKDRRERGKVRRRARVAREEKEKEEKVKALKAKMTDSSSAATPMAVDPPEVVPSTSNPAAAGTNGDAKPAIDPANADTDLPDEATARAKERQELEGLVDPELRQDKGANVSGLYELVGVVTHKGASADGGASLPSWWLLELDDTDVEWLSGQAIISDGSGGTSPNPALRTPNPASKIRTSKSGSASSFVPALPLARR